MLTRNFHLGDILSVTTGVLVAPEGFIQVRGIMGFMVGAKDGDDYDLPDTGCFAMHKICNDALLEQHTGLRDLDYCGALNRDNQGWLADQVARFGERLPVHQLPNAPE